MSFFDSVKAKFYSAVDYVTGNDAKSKPLDKHQEVKLVSDEALQKDKGMGLKVESNPTANVKEGYSKTQTRALRDALNHQSQVDKRNQEMSPNYQTIGQTHYSQIGNADQAMAFTCGDITDLNEMARCGEEVAEGIAKQDLNTADEVFTKPPKADTPKEDAIKAAEIKAAIVTHGKNTSKKTKAYMAKQITAAGKPEARAVAQNSLAQNVAAADKEIQTDIAKAVIKNAQKDENVYAIETVAAKTKDLDVENQTTVAKTVVDTGIQTAQAKIQEQLHELGKNENGELIKPEVQLDVHKELLTNDKVAEGLKIKTAEETYKLDKEVQTSAVDNIVEIDNEALIKAAASNFDKFHADNREQIKKSFQSSGYESVNEEISAAEARISEIQETLEASRKNDIEFAKRQEEAFKAREAERAEEAKKAEAENSEKSSNATVNSKTDKSVIREKMKDWWRNAKLDEKASAISQIKRRNAKFAKEGFFKNLSSAQIKELSGTALAVEGAMFFKERGDFTSVMLIASGLSQKDRNDLMGAMIKDSFSQIDFRTQPPLVQEMMIKYAVESGQPLNEAALTPKQRTEYNALKESYNKSSQSANVVDNAASSINNNSLNVISSGFSTSDISIGGSNQGTLSADSNVTKKQIS